MEKEMSKEKLRDAKGRAAAAEAQATAERR